MPKVNIVRNPPRDSPYAGKLAEGDSIPNASQADGWAMVDAGIGEWAGELPAKPQQAPPEAPAGGEAAGQIGG